MSLRIEIQPITEPVTVDEVKARLRLDGSADDAMILSNITAAREFAEKITERSLITKSYIKYLDCFPRCGEVLRLPMPPLITVDSIKYLDENLDLQTWDAAEYFVADKQIPALVIPRPTYSYPATAPRIPQSVEIHFTAGYHLDGYGDDITLIPEHIRVAVMNLAAHLYDHPEATSPDNQNQVPANFMAFLIANKVWVR